MAGAASYIHAVLQWYTLSKKRLIVPVYFAFLTEPGRPRRPELLFLVYIQGSPSGCVWIEIPDVSQVEKGEHRRSYVYERFGIHWCYTASAAVVPRGSMGSYTMTVTCRFGLSAHYWC